MLLVSFADCDVYEIMFVAHCGLMILFAVNNVINADAMVVVASADRMHGHTHETRRSASTGSCHFRSLSMLLFTVPHFHFRFPSIPDLLAT